MNLACLAWPRSRRQDQTGFTKSSTTGFVSRPVAMRSGVRLISRNGYDFADRFKLAAAAVAGLPARQCVIDGEAIACDENGLAVFDLIRYRRQDHSVVLCAFDLLELDGQDLRRAPIQERKRALAKLLRKAPAG